VPESKHRRKNKSRKRKHQKRPPKNPEPSPPWVPRLGVGLLLLGVLLILLGYVPAIRTAGFVRDLPWLGANWTLVGGFILLTGGFGVLTQWR
jgi:hypothetical protein